MDRFRPTSEDGGLGQPILMCGGNLFQQKERRMSNFVKLSLLFTYRWSGQTASLKEAVTDRRNDHRPALPKLLITKGLKQM